MRRDPTYILKVSLALNHYFGSSWLLKKCLVSQMPTVLKKLVEEGLPVKGLVIGEGPFTSKLSKVGCLIAKLWNTHHTVRVVNSRGSSKDELTFFFGMTLQLPNVQCLGWKHGIELEEAYASSDVLV
jgi:glycosyltransferase involved in cell wall biosynthesis